MTSIRCCYGVTRNRQKSVDGDVIIGQHYDSAYVTEAEYQDSQAN